MIYSTVQKIVHEKDVVSPFARFTHLRAEVSLRYACMDLIQIINSPSNPAINNIKTVEYRSRERNMWPQSHIPASGW